MMTRFIVDPVIGGGGIATTVVPSASVVGAGTMVWDSTIGFGGGLSVSDGTSYFPLTPMKVLVQSAIPVIIPSSGTLSAAGALSTITALQVTYPSCWMFLPANATATVSAAGLYFVQMSSTTAGTVFQNQLTAGSPSVIPATAALVPCTTASSFTTLTGLTNLFSVTVPANSMGPNGRIQVVWGQGNNNSAGVKVTAISFGGSAIAGGPSATTQLFTPGQKIITNRNLTNSQFVGSGSGYATATGVGTTIAVDTTTALSLTFQGNLAVATDTVQFEHLQADIVWQA